MAIVTKTCICNKEFLVKPNTKGLYCSHLCYWENLKNKQPKNTDGLKLGRGWNKGIPMREETKEKLSAIKKNNPIRYWLNKNRLSMTGKNNWNWKGGISVLRDQIRGLKEYAEWSRQIRDRDNYVCQICFNNMNCQTIDHQIPLAYLIKKHQIKDKYEAMFCPDIWDINNGRVVCTECHKKTDTFGGKTVSYIKERGLQWQ